MSDNTLKVIDSLLPIAPLLPGSRRSSSPRARAWRSHTQATQVLILSPVETNTYGRARRAVRLLEGSHHESHAGLRILRVCLLLGFKMPATSSLTTDTPADLP